ncbi:MAG: dephospho-CoA kinase [Deltaproteobacteria bacterium]|nr:MAG: dephospho-CoA kinase [Deltaproteobacteria bacterium]
MVVGLTGGVASGKTTVSEILQEEGAYLIDADMIARQLVEPHSATWYEIRKAFGDDILDENGSLRRKKLAARVFSDPDERKILNQILHPQIRREIQNRLKEIAEKDPRAIVIVDAALLVETGDYREMDKVIVIASSPQEQIERLKQRDGMEEEQARNVLASQMPLEEKRKVADFIICNEGSLEETRKRTREVFRELKKIAPC